MTGEPTGIETSISDCVLAVINVPVVASVEGTVSGPNRRVV